MDNVNLYFEVLCQILLLWIQVGFINNYLQEFRVIKCIRYSSQVGNASENEQHCTVDDTKWYSAIVFILGKSRLICHLTIPKHIFHCLLMDLTEVQNQYQNSCHSEFLKFSFFWCSQIFSLPWLYINWTHKQQDHKNVQKKSAVISHNCYILQSPALFWHELCNKYKGKGQRQESKVKNITNQIMPNDRNDSSGNHSWSNARYKVRCAKSTYLHPEVLNSLW